MIPGKEQIKQILTDQRAAILNKTLGVERSVLARIGTTIKLPHITVLTGLRRVGKSTLLRQIIQKYYDDHHFYYINFEDERLFKFQAADFNILYEALIELYGEQKTFFIDEIQNVANFENFVRRFYDAGFKFFITGSNASLLSREISSKLTGRHFDLIVQPFTFMEYLRLNNVLLQKEMIYNTLERTRIKNLFRNYLISGGMPEFLLYKDPEILTRIYEDIIIKDIAVRYNITNLYEMRDVFLYLITNTAKKFSFNKLRNITGIGSITTVKNYIHYLSESFFITTINKFDYSLKKQLVNDKKAYVVDNGFFNVLAAKVTRDIGWLLENLIFNVLNAAGQIFYFSGKKECDFILQKDNCITTAVQVTSELNSSNSKREINGLLDALKTFDLREGLILTNDLESTEKIDGKTIMIKPVWKWLLENGEGE